MTTQTKKEVVQAAQKIIFGNEGNYGSVNANDKGAVSVGKVQWHAGRALSLLKKICAAESGAASILGVALYEEITTAASGAWNSRTVNTAEKAAISKLLSTDAGKRIQDAQAETDVGAYVDHGLKVGVEDPAALVYFADMENQGGGGASARVAASAQKPVTLDTIHAAGLADKVMGKYSTRRKKVYEAAKKLKWDGTAQKGNEVTMAGKITTGSQLAEAALNVANNFKTLYVMGCFGAPMTAANKARYCKNHDYNKAADRTAMIKAASSDTFGFDCVCLIKGLLWGWSGDASKTYGGSGYAINGVPDIGADTMITKCSGVSTDFSKVEVGEAVWCKGHIGIYIGDGLAVECTPKWKNCVQVTACNCTKSGYNRRNWTKHGKLPYVTYTGANENPADSGAAVSAPDRKPTAGTFGIGDTVDFTGTTHYASSNSTSAVACKPGRAKVTAISAGAKHPYHLVRVSGGKSTVYGWVNTADIAGTSSVADVAVYTVAAGDSLWGIAQKRLGNGNRYKEIMTLNGLTSTTIRPGQKLRLPS